MLSGDFQRKLRSLNPKLHIFCGNDSRRPAGIYHVVRGEYREICGVDKNYLIEHTIREPNGNIVRAGWRRTLKVLINQGFIKRADAERVFNARLHYKQPKKKKVKRSNPLLKPIG